MNDRPAMWLGVDVPDWSRSAPGTVDAPINHTPFVFLRPGYVAMDGLSSQSGEVIPCYLLEDTSWNGWARPMFTFDQAKMIRFEDQAGMALRYDKRQDAFIAQGATGAPEVYKGAPQEINGKTVTLYPIGAGSWDWQDDEDLGLKTASRMLNGQADMDDMAIDGDAQPTGGPVMG